MLFACGCCAYAGILCAVRCGCHRSSFLLLRTDDDDDDDDDVDVANDDDDPSCRCFCCERRSEGGCKDGRGPLFPPRARRFVSMTSGSSAAFTENDLRFEADEDEEDDEDEDE